MHGPLLLSRAVIDDSAAKTDFCSQEATAWLINLENQRLCLLLKAYFRLVSPSNILTSTISSRLHLCQQTRLWRSATTPLLYFITSGSKPNSSMPVISPEVLKVAQDGPVKKIASEADIDAWVSSQAFDRLTHFISLLVNAVTGHSLAESVPSNSVSIYMCNGVLVLHSTNSRSLLLSSFSTDSLPFSTRLTPGLTKYRSEQIHSVSGTSLSETGVPSLKRCCVTSAVGS